MERSHWGLRSSAVAVERGSATTLSCVVKTSLSLVIFTVYVPGRTRGPCAAPNAALAAVGTWGALRRIDHVTRDSPRRFELGIVSTFLPAAAKTSTARSPKLGRLPWWYCLRHSS